MAAIVAAIVAVEKMDLENTISPIALPISMALTAPRYIKTKIFSEKLVAENK